MRPSWRFTGRVLQACCAACLDCHSSVPRERVQRWESVAPRNVDVFEKLVTARACLKAQLQQSNVFFPKLRYHSLETTTLPDGMPGEHEPLACGTLGRLGAWSAARSCTDGIGLNINLNEYE